MSGVSFFPNGHHPGMLGPSSMNLHTRPPLTDPGEPAPPTLCVLVLPPQVDANQLPACVAAVRKSIKPTMSRSSPHGSPLLRAGSLGRSPGSRVASGVADGDTRVLLFHCRRQSENKVVDVSIQAGVNFHRFTERLTNEFGRQVPGFSFFSLATREEVQVGDDAAFAKMKAEMLAPKEQDEEETEAAVGVEGDAVAVDITVKFTALNSHGSAPANRTAEQNAAVMRERAEARQARMKELETLFDGLSAQRRGADAKGDGREFTPWRVNFPLHAAAERGDVEEIERILDKPGTPVEQTLDSIDGLERTALHYAAARGRLEIVDMLLNKGARVDLSDLSQQTALHKAAAGGHTGVCRTIVLAMADANAGDASGVTPLMLAAKSGVVECVQVLMRHGARTSETDAEGNPALAYASRDHIVLRSVLEGVRVGTGKGGDLRVDVKGSVAAAVAGDAVRTGMPVKSSGNLNLEKSEITMRLKKLVQELDNMDLKFAEGRGSAGQVFHWTYACPCRAELLIAEGGSAMLLVSQLSGDMQNQN